MESRLRKNRDIWLKNFLILLFSLNLKTENLTGKTVVADETMVVTRHYLASEVGNQVLTKCIDTLKNYFAIFLYQNNF